MRLIYQVLWPINCWAFLVSFVVCTDSFVGSMWWASLLVLEAKLGCLVYWALGSQRCFFDDLFCVLLLKYYYLGVVNSHLLLRWSSSKC